MERPLFLAPDWNAPIDVDAYVRGIPASATIKGFLPAAVVDAARKRKVSLPGARASYHAFADVPLREYIPVLSQAAVGLFPRVSHREALRKMGRGSRDAFATSMVGRVLLATLLDLRTDLSIVGKALAIATPPARSELREVSDRRAVLDFMNIYTFLDSHHIGILEKVAGASRVRVEARVHLTSPYDGQIELTW